MCTKTIAEATGAGEIGAAAAAGSGIRGGVGAALTTLGVARAIRGKRVIGSDIFPKPPKLPPLKPPEDIAGKERRAQALAFRRSLAGRPGAGRAATIFTGTGSGPAGLKTRTGQ
jgi:hypothetical protein